ncbi:hypothetical protein M1N92_02495, partial [Dehalococcoidia bacterium]|nr:hypothetical protein [Dehalococcoidia bacterium]
YSIGIAVKVVDIFGNDTPIIASACCYSFSNLRARACERSNYRNLFCSTQRKCSRGTMHLYLFVMVVIPFFRRYPYYAIFSEMKERLLTISSGLTKENRCIGVARAAD